MPQKCGTTENRVRPKQLALFSPVDSYIRRVEQLAALLRKERTMTTFTTTLPNDDGTDFPATESIPFTTRQGAARDVQAVDCDGEVIVHVGQDELTLDQARVLRDALSSVLG